MPHVFTVFGKEVLDNLRDRRTLFSALLFGPLFGPLLFAVLITIMLSRTVSEVDESMVLPVTGAEFAPNLMQFLRQNQAEIVAGPDDLEQAQAWVKSGEHSLVLLIGEQYAEALRGGRPAPVRLVSDNSDSQTAKDVNRLRLLLQGYNQKLSALRLQARGISPQVMTPLAVDNVDISTPAGRSLIVLGMMTYFILFSMLMGGLYLAIDVTAGERERGSLEPLLTLPVRRSHLILGKILATCFFMLLSLAITVFAFSAALEFVPLEDLGMSANFGIAQAASILVLMLPFILLGAAFMTVVASFTKSYKEAQSYLSVVLLIPTLPIIFAAIYNLRPAPWLMAVPSLSQHLLITSIMRAEALGGLFVAISLISTLVIGLALTLLAAWLYRREGLLG